ncbi:LOW QUALITY PROTEIN: hypothetical protein ACHAW6_001124, partial [Cyclotella cf. meneghiniana]
MTQSAWLLPKQIGTWPLDSQFVTHRFHPIYDLGVKYIGKEHTLHLKSILKEHFTISTDWRGTRYIGISLDWDYTQQRVHLSMPGYVSQALKQFQHHKPSSSQHQPFP